jgi:hypothetical protein
MIPAILTFIDVLRESTFKRDAKAFIDNELSSLPNTNYIKKNATYNYEPKGESIIELIPFGNDEISNDTKKFLEQRFSAYSSLGSTKLYINQIKNRAINNLEYMEELRSRDSLDLLSQSQKISFLEDRVRRLSRLERDQIPFDELTKEIKINFDKFEQISFSNEISSNFKTLDTMKVFQVKWIDSLVTEDSKIKDGKRLKAFIKQRLNIDTLIIRSVN